jgi:hypothetical protein
VEFEQIAIFRYLQFASLLQTGPHNKKNSIAIPTEITKYIQCHDKLTASLQTIKTCKNNNPVQKSKEKINANNEHMVFGNKV